MGRRVVIIILAVIVVAAAGWVAWRLTRPSHSKVVEPNPQGAEVEARKACADLAEFERMVQANDREDRVRAVLDRADKLASHAADADPRWRSLAGGTAALRVAIQHDDAQAARIGIDVVRAQCADVR